ncbi:hypothetical protein ACIQJ8_33190 [Streptomyces globisporus]
MTGHRTTCPRRQSATKRLADAVRGTPDVQSSIRRKHQSGLRYLGRTDS